MKPFSLFCLLAFLHLCPAFADSADPLRAGFASPPDSAKPHTWWHWMNGNITKEGITADLEAMKQIGLGGATVVNVDCGIPAGPVEFMSPEWREAFRFAVSEADRLGFKLTVANCAGWSESGGPWITPADAMQRLTSSETKAQGPNLFDATLSQPPTNLGFYKDIAVLAFKSPRDKPKATPKPSSPDDKLEIKSAFFGATSGTGGADVTKTIVAMIENGRPSVTVSPGELGGDPAAGEYKHLILDFTLGGAPGSLTINESETLIFPTNLTQLAEAKKHETTSIKETFVQPPPTPDHPDREAIPFDQIVALTDKLDPSGKLRWDVPPGEWTILRIGYTPIGITNHPAPAGGLGLECDKMSKEALDAHWKGFMQPVLDDLGPLAGKALNASLIDSYEVGNQDWSPRFREEFINRRGYDPVKYLPTFTHQVVENPQITERFLWDMRRTIADLFAENYFAHFADLCRERGLLSAVEPYTGPFESLQSGATADVVMGEFWVDAPLQPTVKMAASIAHIYGKTVVGGESFTASIAAGPWQNDPFSLKALGDLMFSQGLNRFYFHRYALQPWLNRWPGMTMGEWGFQFERTLTWWSQGRPWIEYISRCHFLLQQGRAIADAAYFTGETAPARMRVGEPQLPVGYDYDAVNADVLMNGATVRDGRIVLASGASYAVLILPENDIDMTPKLLERLQDLVQQGATIVGPRPQHSPSLEGYPKCDDAVKDIATKLWGKCDGQSTLENPFGKGRVVWGQSLEQIFAAQNLKPDFEFTARSPESCLVSFHRLDETTDIYFVSNQTLQFDSAECTFRVAGKTPEIWHPDTGTIESAPIWSENNGRTTVTLNFDPAGSVFVIFRPRTDAQNHIVSARSNIPDAPAAAALTIKRATYQATDKSKSADVTAALTNAAANNRLTLRVDNATLGGDPASFREKELSVDYLLGDEPHNVVIHEGETLNLPELQRFGQPPQWEAATNSNGEPAVKMWTNGEVELTSSDKINLFASATTIPSAQTINGPWKLTFPENWGAPSSIVLDELTSWTRTSDEGVHFFSGTATYMKEITIPADRLKDSRELWLDLGTVKNFAEISLNGHTFPALWKPPFRVNITAAAKPGTNQLVVKVTNLWPNRLIGDEHLPPDCEWNGNALKAWPQWLLEGKPSPTGRFTFTTWRSYTKESPLLDSGLLGPVTLQTADIIPARPR